MNLPVPGTPEADLNRVNNLLEELITYNHNRYFLNLVGAVQEQSRIVNEATTEIQPMLKLKEIHERLCPTLCKPETSCCGRMLPVLGKLDPFVSELEEVLSSLDLSIKYLSQTRELVSSSVDQGKIMVNGNLAPFANPETELKSQQV